jgi:PleD family two-component response regulator
MNKIKILHLEDSKFDAIIVERELLRSNLRYEHKWVSNQKDYCSAVNNFSPDIILSDHSLPSFSATHALRIIREAGHTIPFILITGTISGEFASRMLNEGVTDYLMKGYLQRLPEAIWQALTNWKLMH